MSQGSFSSKNQKSPKFQRVPKTHIIMTHFHLMRTQKHKILSIIVLNMTKYTIISLIFIDFLLIFFLAEKELSTQQYTASLQEAPSKHQASTQQVPWAFFTFRCICISSTCFVTHSVSHYFVRLFLVLSEDLVEFKIETLRF